MDKWIQRAVKKPGALRKTLGTSKKTGKIRLSDLRKAAKSKNAKTRRRANLALTFRKMRERRQQGG